MKKYIMVSTRKALPRTFELASIMWEKDISLSRSGDAIDLKNCTTLALSWDKWINDKRWSGKTKSSELIYFEIPKKIDKFTNPITIEIADDAVLVDKRAFLKAAIYIAEKAYGKISDDGITWMTPEEYSEMNKETLKYSFEEAAEASLLC